MIYKVLIADDNAEALKSFNYQLKEHEDIKPILVDTAAAALEEIKKDPRSFAAAVLDFNFDDENINGADLALEIQKINKNLRIIICTGDDSRAALKAGYEARVHGFIAKDDTTGFIESLRSCFPIYDEFYRLFAEENKSLKAKYEDNQKYIQQFGMIGRSDNLRSICEIIDQSKDKKSTVLIRGESGTGKELVAKAFHEKSIRADKRFVAINCAALPHNLLESELFGHKRGSFTSADTDKIGKLELAHKGTLFLDEIGDMPLDLQAKLLRALQEGTFYPVGSKEEVRVDVRVVAATNVDLEEAITENLFRQDLYFRLKVIEIVIPPLRDRTEDIEPLVRHFQLKHALHSKKKILYRTIEAFLAYKWLGNIRELENVIEMLFVLSKEEDISPKSLPRHLFEYPSENFRSYTINMDCDYESFSQSIQKFVEKTEYNFLMAKVKSESSIRNAAIKLNLSKSSLQRKLASFGYQGKGACESESL